MGCPPLQVSKGSEGMCPLQTTGASIHSTPCSAPSWAPLSEDPSLDPERNQDGVQLLGHQEQLQDQSKVCTEDFEGHSKSQMPRFKMRSQGGRTTYEVQEPLVC